MDEAESVPTQESFYTTVWTERGMHSCFGETEAPKPLMLTGMDNAISRRPLVCEERENLCCSSPKGHTPTVAVKQNSNQEPTSFRKRGGNAFAIMSWTLVAIVSVPTQMNCEQL